MPVRVSFLVPAAGCGSRVGLGSNKILAPLCGRSVLAWTLQSLAHADSLPAGCALQEIIVAARREEWPLVEDVFRKMSGVALRLVEGGATRQDSVESMARAARGEIVAIHDAARCLIEPSVTCRTIETAIEHGASVAALPASDTVKMAMSGGAVDRTLDRTRVWLAQTPQVFRRSDLLRALEVARAHNFQGTDCASLFEHWREVEGEAVPRVQLVEGSARNFKITFAHDLERAKREMQVLGADA